MSYSFEDVKKLDNALYHLASYVTTKGLILVPKSEEDMLDMEDRIARKFNELKRKIQLGECTFEFLKEDILSRYGPFTASEHNQRMHNFNNNISSPAIPPSLLQGLVDLENTFKQAMNMPPPNLQEPPEDRWNVDETKKDGNVDTMVDPKPIEPLKPWDKKKTRSTTTPKDDKDDKKSKKK